MLKHMATIESNIGLRIEEHSSYQVHPLPVMGQSMQSDHKLFKEKKKFKPWEHVKGKLNIGKIEEKVMLLIL